MAYNDKIVDKLGGFAIPTAIANDSGVDQFLTDGVKDIIENCRKHKPHLIPLFTKTLSQASNSLANLPNADLLRVAATTSGTQYPARFVGNDELIKASISGSIFAATSADPIWGIVSGSAIVLPSSGPSAYEFVYIDPGTVDASAAWSTSNPSYFPSDYENLLVLYGTIRVLNYISLSRMKEASDRIDTAKDKIDALFVATTDEPDILDIQSALDKAKNLIDGTTMGGDTETESAQFWLNDEDSDMVSSTLSVAGQEITRANTIMAAIDKKTTSVSKYTELVAIYIQDIQGIMTLTRELKIEYQSFFESPQQPGAKNEA